METTATTTEKAPYRVEIMRERPNPKYKAGTMAAKYPTIQSREYLFFDTIAEASAWRRDTDLTENAKGKVSTVYLSGLSKTGTRYTTALRFEEAPEADVATAPEFKVLTDADVAAAEAEQARTLYLNRAAHNDRARAHRLGNAWAEATLAARNKETEAMSNIGSAAAQNIISLVELYVHADADQRPTNAELVIMAETLAERGKTVDEATVGEINLLAQECAV